MKEVRPPLPKKEFGKQEPGTRPEGKVLQTFLFQILASLHQGPTKTEAHSLCSLDEGTCPYFAQSPFLQKMNTCHYKDIFSS